MMPLTAQTAKLKHRQLFGSEATNFFSAPGRVNLIGEHTDYNDGFVMPCAISFNTSVAITPTTNELARVIATNFQDATDSFVIDQSIQPSEAHWTNYVRGVVKLLFAKNNQVKGFDMTIVGDIPQGTGLSSSASLEVVTATALNHIYDLGMTPTEIAILGQRAENEFVGCSCGIMDQLISAEGRANSALLIDCRSLQTTQVKLPQTLELVIINPNVERNLVGSEYNVRRQSCEQAAKALGVKALRDADINALEAAKNAMSTETFRRARHIITENERVLHMKDALERNNLKAIHALLRDSHRSMKEDFEITTPELDFVADFINDRCAGEGGCRMTGGGFGGCAVALLTHDAAPRLLEDLAQAYQNTWQKPIDFYHCQLVDGATQLQAN